MPVGVERGTELFAASINGDGVLDVEVTARTTDSSLARVVHMVEEAQERKATVSVWPSGSPARSYRASCSSLPPSRSWAASPAIPALFGFASVQLS